ncbi:hypothetical protein [Streptomyces flaveolus]
MPAQVNAAETTREGLAALRSYLLSLVNSGAALPAAVSRLHGVTLASH